MISWKKFNRERQKNAGKVNTNRWRKEKKEPLMIRLDCLSNLFDDLLSCLMLQSITLRLTHARNAIDCPQKKGLFRCLSARQVCWIKDEQVKKAIITRTRRESKYSSFKSFCLNRSWCNFRFSFSCIDSLWDRDLRMMRRKRGEIMDLNMEAIVFLSRTIDSLTFRCRSTHEHWAFHGTGLVLTFMLIYATLKVKVNARQKR